MEDTRLTKLYESNRKDGKLIQDLKTQETIVLFDDETDEINELRKKQVRKNVVLHSMEIYDKFPEDIFHLQFKEYSSTHFDGRRGNIEYTYTCAFLASSEFRQKYVF